jgi:hypothetical protein
VQDGVGLLQELRRLERQQIGIARPAPTMCAMPPASPSGAPRRARPARYGGRRLVARQGKPRGRSLDQPPPEGAPAPGSAIRALAWARKVWASRATAPMRSGSSASMRPRSVAPGGEEPPVEIATTTSSAIDDRRQDEIAERRTVGDVDRNARHLGGTLGLGVPLQIASGDKYRRSAAKSSGATAGT